jgi:hypothetical protein
MDDDSTRQSVLFSDLADKPVVAKFDQDHASSDGGAVLLQACDRRLGLTDALIGGIDDRRQSGKIRHAIGDLVRQRLCAVWLSFYVLNVLASILLAKPVDAERIWIAIGIGLVAAVIVLGLWLFPRTLAGALLSRPMADAEPAASPDLWLAMVCALLGLWMFTSAFPAFVRDALVIHEALSEHDDVGSARYWLFYNAVEVAIAVWLILGAKGFREVFWWARYAGVRRTT